MELKANTALIIIDQQKGILHPRLGRRNNPEAEARILDLLGFGDVAGDR
jgi:nicotinamidase-related amidase